MNLFKCMGCGNRTAGLGTPVGPCLNCGKNMWVDSHSSASVEDVVASLEARIAALEAAAKEAGWKGFGWL